MYTYCYNNRAPPLFRSLALNGPDDSMTSCSSSDELSAIGSRMMSSSELVCTCSATSGQQLTSYHASPPCGIHVSGDLRKGYFVGDSSLPLLFCYCKYCRKYIYIYILTYII